MAFFENIQTPETSVLVGLDTGDYDAEVSIDELEELAKPPVRKFWQKSYRKRKSLTRRPISVRAGSGKYVIFVTTTKLIL